MLLVVNILCRVDSAASAKELPKYFKLMMNNFTSDKAEVKNATFQNLRVFLPLHILLTLSGSHYSMYH